VCIQFGKNGQVGGYRLGNRSGQLVMMQYSAAPPQHKCTVQSHMCQSIPVDPLDIQLIQRSCVADRIGYRSGQLVIVQISANPLSSIVIGVSIALYHCTTLWFQVVENHTVDRVEARCRSTRVSIQSVDYCSDICQSIIANCYWCQYCIVPLCTTLWFQVCREPIQVSELKQVADRLGYRSGQLIVVQISGHATDS
jgi:hypothetical protein